MAPATGSSIAKRVAAASAAGGGNYFKPGFTGTVELQELKYKMVSTKKRPGKHLAVIAEFKIVNGNGVQPDGTVAGIMEEVDDGIPYPEATFGRVKALVLALAGVKESEVTAEQFEKEFDAAISPLDTEKPSPRQGTRIKLETFAKEREGKEAITKFRYSSAEA